MSTPLTGRVMLANALVPPSRDVGDQAVLSLDHVPCRQGRHGRWIVELHRRLELVVGDLRYPECIAFLVAGETGVTGCLIPRPRGCAPPRFVGTRPRLRRNRSQELAASLDGPHLNAFRHLPHRLVDASVLRGNCRRDRA
jgi:hypothetical protein